MILVRLCLFILIFMANQVFVFEIRFSTLYFMHFGIISMYFLDVRRKSSLLSVGGSEHYCVGRRKSIILTLK